MMMETRPVWMLVDAPMILLFLVAAGIIIYGLTQPRYRVASLSVIGLFFFGLIAAGGLFFARSSSHVVVATRTVDGLHHSSPSPIVMSRSVGLEVSPGKIFSLGVLVVVGVLIYGATQPRYRTASLTTLGVGFVLVALVGTTWVATPVARVETVATQFGQDAGGRVQAIREQEWVSRAVAVTAENDAAGLSAEPERSQADSLPTPSNRIELFEGTRRTGTSLEALPDWIAAPVESDPTRTIVDSGPQASFDECQSELTNAASAQLGARLAMRHPQASGWRPDPESIRRSGAISKRVRETQTVRIDVADAVIREPLYREYWMVASDDAVLDRLLAEWRPTASRQRATWLAQGLGLATLLFGTVAFGIRMASGRPQPIPA